MQSFFANQAAHSARKRAQSPLVLQSSPLRLGYTMLKRLFKPTTHLFGRVVAGAAPCQPSLAASRLGITNTDEFSRELKNGEKLFYVGGQDRTIRVMLGVGAVNVLYWSFSLSHALWSVNE